MTGAQIIAAELKAAGVEVAFVFPGGTISRLLEALDDAGIRVIVCVNEAGCGHAAQGYWRVAGKLAAVVATSGPGVTNCITPMADAYYDRDSVVYLFGQVSTDQMGRGTRQDGFQWTNTVALTQPISVWTCEATRDVDGSAEASCHAARRRRGPAVVSLPADLLK